MTRHPPSCRCVECETKEHIRCTFIETDAARIMLHRLLREYRKAMRLLEKLHGHFGVADSVTWPQIKRMVAKWREGQR